MTPAAPFYFLIYVSAAKWKLNQAELEQILLSSRLFNEIYGITGLLLYKDGNFMQLIEGSKEAVQRTMSRIEGDWRHTHILILLEGPATQRNFPSWTMALPKPHEFTDQALRKYGGTKLQQVFSHIELDKFIAILSTFGADYR